MAGKSALSAAALALLVSLPAPAFADVKAGVDAWSRGDYTAAVAEWRGPAAKGDPDAQFNLAQAFRLGRGVEANPKQAEIYYAKAAEQGHMKAADNLGLLMFQDGRRQEAMPYVRTAADRGDPRAQYLLGIAHFNGDLVEKDWVRAYALLTLANSAGLPQATPAIAQMDDFIPLDQREQAQIVAAQLKQQADARRASQLAAADLNGGASASVAPPPAPMPVRTAAAVPARQNPGGAAAIPRPIPTTSVAPSVAAAQAAVAEAQRVTGTESPAEAGADYARPRSGPPVRTAAAAPSPAPAPAPSSTARPVVQPVSQTTAQPTQVAAATPASSPAPTPASSRPSGPWKVQLGAFSVKGNADRLWSRLASRSEISGRDKLLVPSGRLTKLMAGGFASRGDAQTACNQLKRSGQGCLVTR